MSERTTEDDVARGVAEMRDEVERQLAEGRERGRECPEFLLPLFEAGAWLGARMTADGATPEQERSATFALGQRVAMTGVRNAHRLAAESYDRWRAGLPDAGGRALAEELIEEAKR
jgi:hypothetical protein